MHGQVPTRVSTALTLDPHPEETLISYIFRLAAYRRLPSARMLLSSSKFETFTNQPRPEWMAALAGNSCIDERSLWAISYGAPNRTHAMFRGQAVSQSVIERRGAADRRLCPECMDEDPIHRAIWDLRYVAICPVHRRVLVDTCPACGQPIVWRGGDLTRCDCVGKPAFSSVVAEEAASEDIEPTAAVYGLMGDPRFSAEADKVRALVPFSDMDGANIAEFVFRLGLEKMGRTHKYFSSDNPGDLAWKAHIVMRRGLDAVSPWPDAFDEAIDGMRQRTYPELAKSLRICAGAIERWQRGLPAGQGLHILKAVEDYRALEPERRKIEPLRLSGMA